MCYDTVSSLYEAQIEGNDFIQRKGFLPTKIGG
jgi:hypothetical protein